MSIPQQIVKMLYAKSGNKCAFPGCKNRLVFDEVNQSEMAHIISSKPKGPRHIADFNGGNYDAEGNIMVLCFEHHNLIDTCVDNYPADMLRQMKRSHEASVEKAVSGIDVNSQFIKQFLEICANHKIYEMLGVDLVTPFSEEYIFESEYCGIEFRSLINSAMSIDIDKTILRDIEYFTAGLNQLYSDASFYCKHGENGYANPNFPNPDVKRERQKYVKSVMNKLTRIYNKYMHWVFKVN